MLPPNGLKDVMPKFPFHRANTRGPGLKSFSGVLAFVSLAMFALRITRNCLFGRTLKALNALRCIRMRLF